MNQLKVDKTHKPIDNIVNCLIEDCSDLNEWKEVLLNRDLREKFIKKGEQSAFLFIEYRLNKNENENESEQLNVLKEDTDYAQDTDYIQDTEYAQDKDISKNIIKV